MPRTTTEGPISLTEYGRRRGVSVQAVTKAIKAGRLRESVVRVGGQPKIGDVELADREWAERTRPHADHPPPTRPSGTVDDIPNYNVSRALREAAAARREAALADLAELEVAEKRGEVVSVEQARADLVDRYTVVRTKILGVPSRVAQRLPRLAAEVVPVVESLLREALEELAEDGGGGRGESDDGDDEG